MDVPRNGGPSMQDAEWTKWLWGLFAPFIFHLYKKVEKSISREEFNGTVDALRKSHADTAQEIRQEIRDGNKALADQFNSTVRLLMDTRK